MANSVKTQDKVMTEDLWRLVDKSVQANVGKYEISEESAVAALSVVTSYRQQYHEKQRRAGKASKLKKGILLATQHLLLEEPDISPQEAWDHLIIEGWESDEYDGEIYGDGNKLIQRENRGNITHESDINYNTFRRNYFPKAKN